MQFAHQLENFVILIDRTQNKNFGEPIQIKNITIKENKCLLDYTVLHQHRNLTITEHIELRPFKSTALDLANFYDDYRQYVGTLAEVGHIDAMFHYGQLSYTWAFQGVGHKDIAMGEAKDYYQFASENGHAQASYALAQMYLCIINPDYDIYFKLNREENFQHYLMKSAEQGYEIAQYRLAYVYEYAEKGFEKDDVKAAYWYQQSANQNYPQALNNLGDKYERGKGIERDFVKAAYYYELATQYHIVEAMYNLGRLYLKGKGVPQDEALGCEWLQKAADRLYQPARRKLKSLDKSS